MKTLKKKKKKKSKEKRGQKLSIGCNGQTR